jgi:hypothetical protein
LKELDLEIEKIKAIDRIEHNIRCELTEEQRIERDKLQLEMEKLKLDERKLSLEEKKIDLLLKCDNMETRPLPIAVIEHAMIKTRKNTQKYKIQCIDMKNPSTPYAVFESTIDAERKIPGVFESRIKNAFTEHVEYKGYRWLKIPYDQDENIVMNLPPTKPAQQSPRELIAKLTRDGTFIKQVFASQKEAMVEAQLKPSSRGSMSNAVNHGSLCSNHRYKRWEECSQELKDVYIKTHGEPDKIEYTRNGKSIERYHPISLQLMETYDTIKYVERHFQVSRQTLQNSYEEKRVVKGWMWKIVN